MASSIQAWLGVVSLGFCMSACSNSPNVSPLSDSPTLLSTNANNLSPYRLQITPALVSNASTPVISGYATAGDQVQLYLSTTCSGAPVQNGTVNSVGYFSLTSPALIVQGPEPYSVLATHSDGTTNCSGNHITYIFDNTGPQISAFPENQTVSAVPTTMQFSLADNYSSIADLSSDDSGGEITVSGCSGGSQPTVAINSSQKPLIRVSFSGGSCADGDTLQVTLNANKLYDSIGNAGLVANSETVSYLLALNSPAIVLTRNDGLITPINSSDTLVVNISFLHATGGSTTLVTDPTNANDRILLFGNNAGCQSNIQMGAGLTGGTITISGCTYGTGSIYVTAPNSLVKNGANVSGLGNAVLTLLVDNVGPVISESLASAASYVGAVDGTNTLTFSVTDANGVVALSSTDANGELTVTGTCSVLPSITSDVSTDGMNYTVSLSGGTCIDGDTVTVTLNPALIFDTAGNPDLADSNANQTATYTIDASAQVIVDIGGDDGNPTAVGYLDPSANNLIVYFNKVLSGGSSLLYCGDNYNSLVQIAVSNPVFGNDGSVSWSISAITTANGGTNPFLSGTVCTMDLSGLVDSHGVSVGEGSSTPVTSSFSVN